jgi:N-methylhydantoinase A
MVTLLDDSVVAERDRLLDEMRHDGGRILAAAGVHVEAVRFRYGMDARYRGQGNEVTIWVGEGDAWPASLADTLERFAREYERVYGLRIPDVPVEVVTWRVAAWAAPPAVEIAAVGTHDGAPVPHRTRRVRFDRAADDVEIPVFRREALGAGATVEGPAIVEERETTTVIRPGWTMTVAGDGSLVAVREVAR